MNKAIPVSRRRSIAVLAAALAGLSACGKKDGERAGKLSLPARPVAAALVDVVAAGTRVLTPETPRPAAPGWTLERPHFFDRDGRRFACAVGEARTGNPALSLAAAEDRARAGLLGLIAGAGPAVATAEALPGARTTDFYASAHGGPVFVRLEVAAPQVQ